MEGSKQCSHGHAEPPEWLTAIAHTFCKHVVLGTKIKADLNLLSNILNPQ